MTCSTRQHHISESFSLRSYGLLLDLFLADKRTLPACTGIYQENSSWNSVPCCTSLWQIRGWIISDFIKGETSIASMQRIFYLTSQLFCQQFDKKKRIHWYNELLNIFLNRCSYKKRFCWTGLQLQCPFANDLQLQKFSERSCFRFFFVALRAYC